MLREVPTRGRAMPWHSMAGWRLEARGWRPPAVVGGWIAPPGSRAGPRAAPVGSAPLLEDTDVGGLTLRQRRIISVLLFCFINTTFIKAENDQNSLAPELTWCERNSVRSSLRSAYSMSSLRRNSTTPSPSRCTSAKQTSPASRMWSFKSCQLPVGGRPGKRRKGQCEIGQPHLRYAHTYSCKGGRRRIRHLLLFVREAYDPFDRTELSFLLIFKVKCKWLLIGKWNRFHGF